MRILNLMSVAAAAACWSDPLSCQGLTLVEGQLSTALSVRVIDESQPAAPGTLLLQGIEIKPIEIIGRVANQELDGTRSRRTERNGLVRIELPGGGRLFRYARQGGLFWGFLHVPSNGLATVPVELPGTGTGGITDPFVGRIGVAADGRNAVLMLRSGGCYVLRLDGGVFASTNSAIRFVPSSATILSPSMMVGSSAAFFQTSNRRIWRLPLADGGLPVDCTPPQAPTDDFKPEMALSGDGHKVAFLMGLTNGIDQLRIFLLGDTGNAGTSAARRLSMPAGKYEEPGYLPDGDGHAQLLLNHDGRRLFCLDSTVSDETWLIDTTGALPAMHITDDGIFQPTIGVHILPSFSADTLLVAIGELQQMDWFKVQMSPSGGTAINLTATGSLQQPFPVGSLEPTQGAVVGSKLLTTNQVGTVQTLRSIDPSNGVSVTLYSDLERPPIAGSSFTATPDVVVSGQTDRLFQGTTGNLFAELPSGIRMSPPASTQSYSTSFVSLASQWGIVALYFPNGGVIPGWLDFNVQQLVLTQAGGLVAHSAASSRYLAPGVNTELALPPASIRVFLSGAGG